MNKQAVLKMTESEMLEHRIELDVPECFLCDRCKNCKQCYGCLDCINCLCCNACNRCVDCINCFRCSDCFGCNNQRDKQFMIFDVQLTKEEYRQKMKDWSV
jgi:hypothetical protein